MMEDGAYLQSIQCRWQELRQGAFSNDSILYLVDSLTAHLGPAIDRNFNRWPILGQYVWPNNYVAPTYFDEIDFVKSWILNRADWIDNEWDMECVLARQELPTEESLLKVFPNPTSSILNISFPFETDKNATIKIYSVDSKLVLAQTATTAVSTVSVEKLAKGVYLLQFNYQDAMYYRKIVVE